MGVYFSEQRATSALYNTNVILFITESESVYCAVRTGPLTRTHLLSVIKGLKVGCGCMNWTNLVHDRDRCLELAKTRFSF
jgi:hypothetical protein